MSLRYTPDEAAYTIKESARAKHVRLLVSTRDGSVTVVIPKGFDRREIPEVLEHKRRWIERIRRKVAEHHAAADPDESGDLPALIRLRAIDEEWRVEYRTVRPPAAPDRFALVIDGVIENADACRYTLSRWLRNKAGAHLRPWLTDLSARNDLPISRVAVRSQRTRWGSCSARSCVNLNQKLLFLPPPMVEQVMLHELCHTVHHNHSGNFWRLLESLSPNCRLLEAELRTAWRYVPAWLDRR